MLDVVASAEVDVNASKESGVDVDACLMSTLARRVALMSMLRKESIVDVNASEESDVDIDAHLMSTLARRVVLMSMRAFIMNTSGTRGARILQGNIVSGAGEGQIFFK